MRKKELKELIHNFPDRSIKWLLEAPSNLREFLVLAIGDLSQNINCNRIEKVDRTFILENFRKLEADMVFKAHFEDTSEKLSCEIIVYILIEHQSTVDHNMTFRVLSYMVQIWEMQRKEWEEKNIPLKNQYFFPILPIVFYTGDQTWDRPLEMRELMKSSSFLDSVIPNFKIFFLNLKTASLERLLNENCNFGQVLRIMQNGRAKISEFKKILIQAIEQLDKMPLSEQENWQKLIYFIFMFIYNRREQNEHHSLISILEENVKNRTRQEEVKKMGKTIAQSLIEEGIQKGMQQGMQKGIEKGIEKGRKEGLLQGMQKLLVDALRLRFETVPYNVEISISKIKKMEILEALHQSAIKCSNINEFENQMKAIIKGSKSKN